jgi:uncharacterized membrane protein (UPF0127 family)
MVSRSAGQRTLERTDGNRMNQLSKLLRGLWDSFARRRQAAPATRLRVSNLTRNTVLATSLELADSGPTRNRGLLGRQGLAPGEGLWIIPCEAVHTFFMQFPIDLVYLDRNKRVRKLRSEVPAWRLSGCLSAHSVLELPAGTIRETQTQRGDSLELSPAVLAADSLGQERP